MPDPATRELARALFDALAPGGQPPPALPPGLRGPTVRLLTRLTLDDADVDAYLGLAAAERARRGLGPGSPLDGPADCRLADLARDGYAALADPELHRLACSPLALRWAVMRLHDDPAVAGQLGRWFFDPVPRAP